MEALDSEEDYADDKRQISHGSIFYNICGRGGDDVIQFLFVNFVNQCLFSGKFVITCNSVHQHPHKLF